MLQSDYVNEATPASTPTPTPRTRRRVDAGTLFVGILVVAASAGLYYMHWRTAETLKLIQRADADAASVQSFLNGGRENLATLSKSIRETRATVNRLTGTASTESDGEYIGANARIASATFDARNPFTFESLEPKSTVKTPTVASNSAREATKAKLLAEARTLQVQSIMFGSARRSCLINGKLYFEGQPCGGFVVESISQASVFVQSGEFRFELRFRK